MVRNLGEAGFTTEMNLSPIKRREKPGGFPFRKYWPYCNAARQMTSLQMDKNNWSSWDQLKWRRRLETFGKDDRPVIATGPQGEVDAVCDLGQLTDKGRETTLALGQRLRHLYVDQLGFMPKLIANADMMYLRATPLPRALESIQQSFWGMYPLTARTASFSPPTVITRTPADETLLPNESNCRRFNQLSRAFAQRAAKRWNDTKEMTYINFLISKWMPEQEDGSHDVAVDSHPRLCGIMDTINSTLAHGPKTKLPSNFYDTKVREIGDKIAVEEWYSGYKESQEYRTVGIGALVGDVVSHESGMMRSVLDESDDYILEAGDEDGGLSQGRSGEQRIKFGMSGCHDHTLAAMLSSLGTFEGEKWPPYTSHLAVELFRRDDAQELKKPTSKAKLSSRMPSFWSTESTESTMNDEGGISGKATENLGNAEKEKMDGYFVRLRYNDRPMTVPGCRPQGKHLDGNESFCTLEAFKAICDKFTPKNWKEACTSNLDKPFFPATPQDAGF
ncbi:MAG: hypothetical protein Q9191_006550 [Dirinaria sp. TL-2023a]